MSKILRVTQKIFGSSAGPNQIAEFGSLAAGTPTFTTDPTVIQSLSNYLEGWFAAVIGGNSPAIEDLNAVTYLYAYQLAYIMQAGIPEYDTGTTYYIGSFVNSAGVVYVSLTDNNLNNPVTDATNWSQPSQNGVIIPNSVPASTNIPANSSMYWPYMSIPVGKTVTIPSSSQLVSVDIITVNGTLVVNGICKVL